MTIKNKIQFYTHLTFFKYNFLIFILLYFMFLFLFNDCSPSVIEAEGLEPKQDESNNNNMIYYIIGGTLVLGIIIVGIYFGYSGGADCSSRGYFQKASDVPGSYVVNDPNHAIRIKERFCLANSFDITPTYNVQSTAGFCKGQFLDSLWGDNLYLQSEKAVTVLMQQNQTTNENIINAFKFLNQHSLVDPRVAQLVENYKNTGHPPTQFYTYLYTEIQEILQAAGDLTQSFLGSA